MGQILVLLVAALQWISQNLVHPRSFISALAKGMGTNLAQKLLLKLTAGRPTAPTAEMSKAASAAGVAPVTRGRRVGPHGKAQVELERVPRH